MSDLQRLIEAVRAMRAAQKLEWDALPSNFSRYKRARQKQRVSQLEASVDTLLQELSRADPPHDSHDNRQTGGQGPGRAIPD